jgi:hypothetical protein
MWRLFYLVFEKPAAALLSSLQMLGEDVPVTMKTDAMISRTTHILSRAVHDRHRSERFTADAGVVAEQKDRTI